MPHLDTVSSSHTWVRGEEYIWLGRGDVTFLLDGEGIVSASP